MNARRFSVKGKGKTAEKPVKPTGPEAASRKRQADLYVEKRRHPQRRQSATASSTRRYLSKVPVKEKERRAQLRRKADLVMVHERHRDNMFWLAAVAFCLTGHILLSITVLMGDFFK